MRRVRKIRSKVFWDRATLDSTVVVAGMGRSGTTWAADLLNYDGSHRLMFEPFDSRYVKAAKVFRYVQYMSHQSPDASLVASARKILGGQIRNRRVDIDNRGFVLRRRIVKTVRANLMLRWLKAVCPEIAVVLVVRHPLSVALSWQRLGWGAQREGSDFQMMVDQPRLLRDFPVLADTLKQIDVENAFERVVFLWCAFHLVPLAQFRPAELTLVFYENLVTHPEQELQRLFGRLGRCWDWSRLSPCLARPSKTDFLGHAASHDHGDLLNGWRRAFTGAQIRRAHDILAMAGVEHVYPGLLATPGSRPFAVTGPHGYEFA